MTTVPNQVATDHAGEPPPIDPPAQPSGEAPQIPADDDHYDPRDDWPDEYDERDDEDDEPWSCPVD